MITTNSSNHAVMPHSHVKAEGAAAGDFLEAVDVQPLSSFDLLGTTCETESLESGFVPLSVSPCMGGGDELSLDSLSDFDAAFDPMERLDGDQELMSWLTMDTCESGTNSATDECSDVPQQQPSVQIGTADRQLVLPKRDVRASPYARRSARRHHG